MSHLTINGIPVECSASEWEPIRLGEVARSLNGAPRSSVRATKRDYRFSVDPFGLSMEEAEVLRALIEGEGHLWTFDVDFTSSRGLSYAASSGTVTAGVAGGLYNEALEATTGATMTWLPQVAGAWTLLFWRWESTDFFHYVIRRPSLSGTKEVWRDSVKTDVDPGVFTLNTVGQLVLDATAATEIIDDAVLLPYSVPDTWPALMYADRANLESSALPFVRATGPGVPSAGITALGQAGPARRVPMIVDGTPTVGEVFDFTLLAT
ncbi:MAG: hypothetical protein JXB05_15690 [Myxococcaceae bacterium]|nr:hypothetical protein [Myxococcaceae bacterium]